MNIPPTRTAVVCRHDGPEPKKRLRGERARTTTTTRRIGLRDARGRSRPSGTHGLSGNGHLTLLTRIGVPRGRRHRPEPNRSPSRSPCCTAVPSPWSVRMRRAIRPAICRVRIGPRAVTMPMSLAVLQRRLPAAAFTNSPSIAPNESSGHRIAVDVHVEDVHEDRDAGRRAADDVGLVHRDDADTCHRRGDDDVVAARTGPHRIAKECHHPDGDGNRPPQQSTAGGARIARMTHRQR